MLMDAYVFYTVLLSNSNGFRLRKALVIDSPVCVLANSTNF